MDTWQRIGVTQEGTGKRLLEQIRRKSTEPPLVLPEDTSEEGLQRTCQMLHNIYFANHTRNQVVSRMCSVTNRCKRPVHVPLALWEHIEMFGSPQRAALVDEKEEEDEWTVVPPASPSKFSAMASFVRRYLERVCSAKTPVMLLCDNHVMEMLIVTE